MDVLDHLISTVVERDREKIVECFRRGIQIHYLDFLYIFLKSFPGTIQIIIQKSFALTNIWY